MKKTGQVMNCFLNDKILNIIKYYLPEKIYPKNPEQYKACKNKEGQDIFKLEVKYRDYRNLIIHNELSQKQREDFEKMNRTIDQRFIDMENETVVAEKDMDVLGIRIKKGTQVKRLTDSMIALTEVVQIGYYDAVDVVNEVKNKNNED